MYCNNKGSLFFDFLQNFSTKFPTYLSINLYKLSSIYNIIEFYYMTDIYNLLYNKYPELQTVFRDTGVIDIKNQMKKFYFQTEK